MRVKKGSIIYNVENDISVVVGFTGRPRKANIPKTVDGAVVAHIGGGAFDGCTSLSEIKLPDTLTHIGDGAFDGCTGLTSITLPDTLTHISGWAFNGCTGLTAEVFARYIVVPQSGSFRAWKKCVHNGKQVIVELEIPEDAHRSSAPCRSKCRASKAIVVSMSGGHTTAVSKTHTEKSTTYEIGKIVECHEWCSDFWQECAGGIHFFMTREEAENL